MCGIAGWITFTENLRDKKEIYDLMLKSMEHRGPDDEGRYISENAALLHRRLCVVDIDNGKQPMIKEQFNNKYILVYNGELYNTEEIRKDLIKNGYVFKGHGDTEVLLNAYIEWGEECLSHLNGIFAFAVWDTRMSKLFMARDRMGVKPLFYTIKNEGLIFGSEVKTVLAHPYSEAKIDREGIAEIMLLGPGRSPGNGVFKGIYELKPGFCATFDREGYKEKCYWEIKAQPFEDDEKTAIEKVRFLVIDAISRQLVSDVPLCTFLSGGLDSSIITAVATDKFKKNGERLSTFSVGYTDNDLYFQKNLYQPDSDTAWAKWVSEFTDSFHTHHEIDTEDLSNALYDATIARDFPGMADIDSSLLLFCRKIKESYTVALSGECADEIFGGYPWYHNRDMLFSETFPWSQSVDFRCSFLNEGIITKAFAQSYMNYKYLNTVKATPKLGTENLMDNRIKEMTFLNLKWFMQTLLDRKDRMSMACGLEVRVPFCDHRIVEYVYNMPWSIKALNNREKGVLRAACKGLLPDDVLMRKKSPYPKTFNPQYFETVKNTLSNILSKGNSPIKELLDEKKVRSFLQESTVNSDFRWYGQLMATPQIIAYLITLNYWLEHYKVTIC